MKQTVFIDSLMAAQGLIKTMHWNIRGQDFLTIHKLLDKVSESMLEYIDEFAEILTSMDSSNCNVIIVQSTELYTPIINIKTEYVKNPCNEVENTIKILKCILKNTEDVDSHIGDETIFGWDDIISRLQFDFGEFLYKFKGFTPKGSNIDFVETINICATSPMDEIVAVKVF
jgi:DNA-binding ferritin-like protein